MPTATSPKPARPELHGISYDDVKPGKPPIPITTAPRPSSAQANIHPSLRGQSSPQRSLDGSSAQSNDRDDFKRDSGFTVTTSTVRDSRTTLATDIESVKKSPSVRKSQSIRKSQSLPRFNGSVKQSPSSVKRVKRSSDTKTALQEPQNEAPKLPEPSAVKTTSELPTISFDDLTKPDTIQFSKRGSLYIGGHKANDMPEQSAASAAPNGRPKKARISTISTASQVHVRILSDDDEVLSQRVRSMYDNGTDDESFVASGRLSTDGRQGIEEEVIEEEPATPNRTLLSPDDAIHRRFSSNTAARRASFIREEQELAGGIEDWQDISAAEVDRYGFISPNPTINASSSSLLASPAPQLHRVSTALQLASEAPRRSYSRLGRVPSASRPARSISDNRNAPNRPPSRPVSSQSSYMSNGRPVSRMRSAANRLPHNRGRRAMDEAADMLTLPPGLANLAEQAESGRNIDAIKKKEWAREEKWRKMTKVTRPNGLGGNTLYEFDTKDPKVISRTWKGIPDRWRATAWHCFLTTSAKRCTNFTSDQELIFCFNELVDQSSSDDVQIDIDVPRTINSHIMFRRRYRGGQRLLFRVLHALSLYFPDTGYVQGMAALAATFLCYFEEAMAFVMLVRLWQVRGLDRLYKSGFSGLMLALDEFEKKWLAGGAINAKLVNTPQICSPVPSPR